MVVKLNRSTEANTKEELMKTIRNYVLYGGKINNIVQNTVPEGAGEKSGKKKVRRGNNDIHMSPIIETVSGNEITSTNDPMLDIPKPFSSTQPWHNTSPFLVHLLSDGWCKNAKVCETCGVNFPANKSVEAQIIIIHKEVSYGPKDNNGECILTKKPARKFYCCEKKCLLKRHPYFWKGLVKVTEATKQKLKEVHFAILYENLHYVK